ncbi:MAG: hypothetical protein J5680_07385 [Neisseriaceae bacterium]|nr:hypothetical protein [Neisseriaceae bacterium]
MKTHFEFSGSPKNGLVQGRSFWTAKIREFDQTKAFALSYTGLLGGRIPVHLCWLGLF